MIREKAVSLCQEHGLKYSMNACFSKYIPDIAFGGFPPELESLSYTGTAQLLKSLLVAQTNREVF